MIMLKTPKMMVQMPSSELVLLKWIFPDSSALAEGHRWDLEPRDIMVK